jgi:WhiB family redox-sensing transcriptional regulator
VAGLTTRPATGTTWRDSALCAQTDPESFFPEKGTSARDAKKTCLACEVRTECLEYALAHDERHGIWGGLTETARRKLRPAPETHAGGKPPAPCGTTAAYQRHLRNDEPVDDACREAVRVRSRSRRRPNAA